jgi:hypothetical protein
MRPTGIVASIGSDVFAPLKKQVPKYAPGRKYPILNIEEFTAFQKKYGLLSVPEDRIFSGLSGGNFAVGVDKLRSPDQPHGQVLVYTALSPTDPESTKRIRRGMEVTHNIKLLVEPNTAPDGGFVSNPVSLILPPKNNPAIVGYKPPSPAINAAEYAESPGVLVLGPTSGDWVNTTYHSTKYAADHNIPVVIFASESQIKQVLKDDTKKEAYLKGLRTASAFIGNRNEAEMIVAASNLDVPSDPDAAAKLTLQLKKASGGSLTDVSITDGRRGAVYRDVNDNLYTLTGPKFPWAGVKPYVNRLGLGDAYGAVLFHALQSEGISEDSIHLALRKAGYGTALATRAEDAQSPQMTLEEYNQAPPDAFKVDMKPSRSEQLPPPQAHPPLLGM